MSYHGSKKGNYGNKSHRHVTGFSRRKFSRFDTQKAVKAFEKRPLRNRKSDLLRLAKIAPNLQVWLKNISSFDFPAVDTPNVKLHLKSRRQQVKRIAEMAEKGSLKSLSD